MSPQGTATSRRLTGLVDFALPSELEARQPAEVRPGSHGRADVRLLVARRSTGELSHHRFADLVDVLAPGDVLVVNTSATLPAAVPVRSATGDDLEVHLSTRLGPDQWSVELRLPDGVASRPYRGGRVGDRFTAPDGSHLHVVDRYLGSDRLWQAELHLADHQCVLAWLAAEGHPIRYSYVTEPWPISAYQTVFADEPGSAEMPSAARPFTAELVTALVARGVELAPLVLHTGVASLEDHEPPYAEQFRVPEATARRLNAARRAGGRVIAVGTTVVRALETVVDAEGLISAGEGWTDVIVTPERGVRAVDGMITGWHEPAASHLAMLEGVAGRPLLEASYAAALDAGYLWHEFGDSHLILP